MLKTRSPILRTGMLAVLLPVLLLLPTFHTHPDQRHAHGHENAHGHPVVVHADFFPASANDAHDHHHPVEDQNSLPSDASIRLFTLLPRSFALLTPALEYKPFPSFIALSLVSTVPPQLVTQPWMQPSGYPKPLQANLSPATSPRSPPRLT